MTIFRVAKYEVSSIGMASTVGAKPWRGRFTIVDTEKNSVVIERTLDRWNTEMTDAIADADAVARAYIAGLKPENISWGEDDQTAA